MNAGGDVLKTCEKCGADSELYLCWPCTKILRGLLSEVADLVPELELQVTKQSVGEKSVGGGSDEAPLLFDEQASAVLDLVLETASSWVPDNPAGLDLYVSLTRFEKAQRLVDYLVAHVALLARDPAAGKAFNEFGHLRAQISKAIDRRPERTALGTCSCGRPLTADARAQYKTCGGCQRVYDVQGTRDHLIDLGRDQWITARQAEELGEIAPGRRFKASTIRSWQRRGKVQWGHEDSNGSNSTWYRFGDLLDLLLGKAA